MRTAIYATLWLAGLAPLVMGWRANRGTSLPSALGWSMAAWLAWGMAFLAEQADQPGLAPARYVALAVTGGAGVAVLGARRPQVRAWNFVVLGLIAVMLWPLLESLVIGTHPADPLRIFFLSATLGVGLLNYLPTRAAPAVLLLIFAEAGEVAALFTPMERARPLFDLLMLMAPWAIWGCWRDVRASRAAFDREWLDFRDRLGLFWAQRVREQFNRAAAHADWPVHLSWRGLHRKGPISAIPPAEQDAMVETLRAALARFTVRS